jgi:hypothetical protein
MKKIKYKLLLLGSTSHKKVYVTHVGRVCPTFFQSIDYNKIMVSGSPKKNMQAFSFERVMITNPSTRQNSRWLQNDP